MVNKITETSKPLEQIDTINEIIDALDSGSVSIDDKTITQNISNELQTVGVIDDNSGNAIKTWTGTKAEYDAISVPLYCWGITASQRMYTISETPSEGDTLYYSNGEINTAYRITSYDSTNDTLTVELIVPDSGGGISDSGGSNE